MKTLLIPDIHLRHQQVDKIIKHEAADKVIFLGDHFDQLKDSPAQNRQAALWVKARMKQHPEDVWIWGNHDVHYAFNARCTQCSGYSGQKDTLINLVMGYEDWSNFVFYHWLDGRTLVSHGGLAKHHLATKPEHLTIKEWLALESVQALALLRQENSHWIYSAGYRRGGRIPKGGLTWLDWHAEFESVPGIDQIVGHSVISVPDCILDPDSINYNLDTNGNHYGIWDGTKLTTKYAPDEILRWS